MTTWDAADKKEFRIDARSFYLACSKAQLRTVPLDNKVIFHARLLSLQNSDAELEVCCLRFLAGQLPQVVMARSPHWLTNGTFLSGAQFTAAKATLCPNERVGVCWARIFALKTETGEQKYPLLSKVVKAILSLPHGNAERGFSENKHFLDGPSSLNVASINGMRQIKST